MPEMKITLTEKEYGDLKSRADSADGLQKKAAFMTIQIEGLRETLNYNVDQAEAAADKYEKTSNALMDINDACEGALLDNLSEGINPAVVEAVQPIYKLVQDCLAMLVAPQDDSDTPAPGAMTVSAPDAAPFAVPAMETTVTFPAEKMEAN